MSSWLWWTLAGSIPVAIVIMFTAFIIMRAKIKKVTFKHSLAGSKDNDNPALTREDHGNLLWDLKKKTKNPLDDLSMELAINTILRNRYNKLYIEGFQEKYEETTLMKKTNVNIVKQQFNFALINFDETLIDRIDKIIKQTEKYYMIMIVNATKNKKTKELMTYLKYTGIRHEHQKVGNGVILIAG